MAPRRSSYEFQDDEDGHEALQRAGKALLGAKLGKDQLLRTLRVSLGQLWVPISGSKATESDRSL